MNQLAQTRLLQSIEEAVVDTDGQLDACSIGLFTSPNTINQSLTVADLVEVAYTGYARQPITWGPSDFPPGGEYRGSISDLISFPSAFGHTPDPVVGWFVVKTTPGTAALLLGLFDTPITLQEIESEFSGLLFFGLSQTDNWGRFDAVVGS